MKIGGTNAAIDARRGAFPNHGWLQYSELVSHLSSRSFRREQVLDHLRKRSLLLIEVRQCGGLPPDSFMDTMQMLVDKFPGAYDEWEKRI